MSIKAMSYVWEQNIPTASQKLMLLAIADRCDDEGMCFPGISSLAKKCNVNERTAAKTLAKLEETGDIVVLVRDGIKTSSGPTNRYYMKKFRESIGLSTPTAMTRVEQLEKKTAWERPVKLDKEVSNLTGDEMSKTTPDEVSNLTGETPEYSSENPSALNTKESSSLREEDALLDTTGEIEEKSLASEIQEIAEELETAQLASVEEKVESIEPAAENQSSENSETPAQADPDPIAPEELEQVEASEAVKLAEEHVAKNELRKRVFAGVSLLCFDIDANSDDPKMKTALANKSTQKRIGKISSWLMKLEDTQIAEKLWEFSKHYKQKFGGIPLPRDADKFADHFTAYLQSAETPKPNGFDNHRRPTESDYAAPDIELPDDAIGRLPKLSLMRSHS